MGQRIEGLDALRGIAALAVVVAHYADIFLHSDWPEFASVAVNLFFIISGFVMARIYEPSFPSPRRFMVKRWRRLWIAYAIGLILGVVYKLETGEMTLFFALAALGFGLLFLPYLGEEGMFTLNPPGWSLTMELIANLFHAVALRRIGTGGLVVVALGCAFVSAIHINLHGLPGVGSVSGWWGKLPMVLGCYCLGIILARGEWRLKLPAPVLWPLGMLAVTAIFGPMIGLLVSYTVAPLVVLAFISSKPFVLAAWLGRISYPLYATHFPVFLLLREHRLVALWGALSVAILVAHFLEPKQRTTRRAVRKLAAQ